MYEAKRSMLENAATSQAEAELARAHRQLRMLSACHQTTIRAGAEQELLQNICRIIVEVGGYRFTWVGYAEHDAGKTIRPVAHMGIEAGYLDSLHISWGEGADKQGPAAKAIRLRIPQVCHDIANDASLGSWRHQASARGYASLITVPLITSGDCIGMLAIYSERRNAFDQQERQLLNQLASDLAYGIGVLRGRLERKRAEAQVARLTRVLRMQSAVNSAVLRISDRDELLSEACRIATEVGGYARVTVSIVEGDGRRARTKYKAGLNRLGTPPEVFTISDGTEPDTSLTGRALRTGEIVVCPDLTRSDMTVHGRESLIAERIRSIVALPIIVGGARVGALTLASRHVDLIREDELLLLKDITSSLSFALRSQQQASTAQFLEYYDPLTGLARRDLFCRRLDALLRGRSGPEGHPAVAAFDLQQLGHINDSFGYRVGNLLLQQVADRFKRRTAGDERIGYLGGGTFVLIEAGLRTSKDNVTSELESSVFSEPFVIEDHRIRVSCRLGVARFPVDGQEGSTLVQKAEAALKRAKETGEQYLHYKLEMRGDTAARLALEHKLRTAIEEQQFELYYQPQLSIATGRIESLEALLRWNDPEGGVVLPGRFLPVLESSGMIVPLGQWVLGRAVQDLRRWQASGLRPVRIAVNVSALQIRRRAFVQNVLDLVAACPNAAGYGIDLEITETTLLQDVEGTSRKLRELRAAGIRIALDDFGTGYSSLGLLSRLPVDLIKIDRSFVSGLPDEAASTTLVESIIRLAAAFGLKTVAEGVETAEQLAILKHLRCDQSQGYLHCRPVPGARLEQILADDP